MARKGLLLRDTDNFLALLGVGVGYMLANTGLSATWGGFGPRKLASEVQDRNPTPAVSCRTSDEILGRLFRPRQKVCQGSMGCLEWAAKV